MGMTVSQGSAESPIRPCGFLDIPPSIPLPPNLISLLCIKNDGLEEGLTRGLRPAWLQPCSLSQAAPSPKEAHILLEQSNLKNHPADSSEFPVIVLYGAHTQPPPQGQRKVFNPVPLELAPKYRRKCSCRRVHVNTQAGFLGCGIS